MREQERNFLHGIDKNHRTLLIPTQFLNVLKWYATHSQETIVN